MEVITVINQKGGVGKSTISVNLSYGLSLKGKRVLIVDLDPQAHSTVIYMDSVPIHTITDIFQNRSFDIKESIHPTITNEEEIDNLKIIPSTIRLASSAEQVASRVHREKILYKALQTIKNDYDYVVIDCPPTLGVLAVNGIYAADRFLIPINYSKYALDGVSDLFSAIDEIKEGEAFDFKIVKNMYDKRTKQTNQYIDSQLESFDSNVLKTIIRKSESINQAVIVEKPVCLFDPKGNGAQDFKALTEELIDG